MFMPTYCSTHCSPYCTPRHRASSYVHAPACGSILDFMLLLALLPLVPALLKTLVVVGSFVLVSSLIARAVGELCPAAKTTGCYSAKVSHRASPRSCAQQRSAKDWSSMRMEETEDTVRIIIAAPGIRTADLKVSIDEEGALDVEGKTKGANGTVWFVHRRVAPPRAADVQSAEVTHVDGVITIAMKRKPITRIPVVQVAVSTEEAASTSAAAEEVKEKPGQELEQPEEAPPASSDGEWAEVEKE